MLVGICFIGLGISVLADSSADWQSYTDKVLRVKFRYPKGWKTNPGYYDRTYFDGSDGSVQLGGAGGDTPQRVCQEAAEHVVTAGQELRRAAEAVFAAVTGAFREHRPS